MHSRLTEDETLYDHMPQGFIQYDKKVKAKVLKLNRCSYGLKNNPRAFFKFMVDKLEFLALKQIKLDLCLFIGYMVITVMYVHDILMWYPEYQNMIHL